MDDVLKDIAWVKTVAGYRTPKEALLENKLLSTDVPGYVYGATLRFLLTLMPLIVEASPTIRRDRAVEEAALEEVFLKLSPHSQLKSRERPFLQVTKADVQDEAFAEGRDASKLFPQGHGPEDNQAIFWRTLATGALESLQEATLGLLSFYFYGPGTNTFLLAGKKQKLSNGSPGLQYGESVEIVPTGDSLIETLLMNLPKGFMRSASGELLPHWADRGGEHMEPTDALWKFSWSSNTVATSWEDNALVKITRGGVPAQWGSDLIPMAEGDAWGKGFHDLRQQVDPLFFYVPTKDGELKLKRLQLSTERYQAVAQWHAEKLTPELNSKWSKHYLYDSRAVKNILFLEHGTEGTSQSFNIRYSRVMVSWPEELLLQETEEGLARVADSYEEVLRVHQRLRGMFSPNGTCKHLAHRQDDVSREYWNETHGLVQELLKGPKTQEELQEALVRSAIGAFEQISSRRNSLHIDKHLQGVRLLQNLFYERRAS